MTLKGKEPVVLVVGAPEYGETIKQMVADEEVSIHSLHRPDKFAESFHRLRPDVTVIDCVSPGVKGFAFFRWLRLESRLPPHPCLLIVASEDEVQLPPEETRAPVKVVPTPIHQRVVVEMLKRLVKLARSRPAAAAPGPAAAPVTAAPPDAWGPTAGQSAPPGPAPAAPPNPWAGSAPGPGAAPPNPWLSPPPAPGPAPGAAGNGFITPDPSLVGLKIMIVDDDPGHSQVLAEFLELGGFEVVQSSNLRAFENTLVIKPHLIVMDIRMPIIDGLTLTDLLKNCHLTRHIPIVILSAMTDGRFIDESKRVKAAAFIPKPVKGSQFLVAIQAILRQAMV